MPHTMTPLNNVNVVFFFFIFIYFFAHLVYYAEQNGATTKKLIYDKTLFLQPFTSPKLQPTIHTQMNMRNAFSIQKISGVKNIILKKSQLKYFARI